MEKEIKSEIKKSTLIHMVNAETSTLKIGNYFSSYNKLIRFLAWMRRFFINRKKEINKKTGLKDNNHETREISKIAYLSEKARKKLRLTFAEIKMAETKLLNHLQNQMFTTASKEKLSSFKTMKNEDGLYILKTKI